jgi:hypothetical protein
VGPRKSREGQQDGVNGNRDNRTKRAQAHQRSILRFTQSAGESPFDVVGLDLAFWQDGFVDDGIIAPKKLMSFSHHSLKKYRITSTRLPIGWIETVFRIGEQRPP